MLELDLTGNLTNKTIQQRREEQMSKDKLRQEAIDKALIHSALQMVGEKIQQECSEKDISRDMMDIKIKRSIQVQKAVAVSDVLKNSDLKVLALSIRDYDLFSANVEFMKFKKKVENLNIISFLDFLMGLDEQKKIDWIISTDNKYTKDDVYPKRRTVRLIKLDNSFIVTATYTDL